MGSCMSHKTYGPLGVLMMVGYSVPFGVGLISAPLLGCARW